MHHQVRVNHARLLQLVGDDATDEVGLSGTQGGHQVVQLLPIRGRYGGETTALLATTALAAAAATGVTGLTGMVGEDFYQQLVSGLLELIDHRVVQRVLVLLQPAGDIIWYLRSEETFNFTNIEIETIIGESNDIFINYKINFLLKKDNNMSLSFLC